MKKYKMLLRAAIRRKRGKLFAIFLMIIMAVLCMGTGITLSHSGTQTLQKEMKRLGFGDFTIWIDGAADQVAEEIKEVPGVEKINVQPLIYAGYEINGTHSDNEGQLLSTENIVPYDFILEDGTNISVKSIESGSIYISPAMKSSFDVEVGDVITFELGRSHGKREFTVAGFFADGFMGSSMIDMKSFLINKDDYDSLTDFLEETTEVDRLGRIGAMLHVFKDSTEDKSSQELLAQINENTGVSLQTEFTYQKETIQSYMLLLQNILSGFLLAFSIVLFLISMVVAGKSIRDEVEEEKKDLAILKAIGMPSKGLRNLYFLLYLGTITLGCLFGAIFIYPMSLLSAKGMVTSTGLLVGISVPVKELFAGLVMCLLLFALFLSTQLAKILKISPMEAIRQRTASSHRSKTKIKGKHMISGMTIREITSKKKSYLGICIIGVILVFFLSIIGKMGNWLGPNGEGLMNAFSVAEHDIGVQPFSQDVPMDEIERVINWYSPVTQKYELAMEEVNLEGLSVTANVLNDTSYFHILEGRACEGNEILITETIAKELNLSVGDTVTVTGSGRKETYEVSGIYQCANGMGNNIGMSMAGFSQIGDTSGFIWCYHYMLEDGAVRDYVMKYLQENYESIDVHTNSWSGLSGIVAMMHGLMITIYMIAAVFVGIAVKLTSDHLLRIESANMAIYKSMGMSNGMLQKSFVLRFTIVTAKGSIMGLILSECLSERLIGRIFASFGIADFTSHVSFTGIVLPAVLVVFMFSLFALMMSSRIKKISIVRLLNENEE
ncbi:MAG: hypothetical protein Q4F05_19205 [bacterium]|nr:hypothetical protein [bacterium]